MTKTIKKVVIIEDEEQLGKLIQSYLEQHEYRAIHVRDGANGLKKIREEVPDLILMDLLLPRVHGFDICQAVKKDPKLAHIPLIVMTAVYKTAMDKMEAERLGVDEFIEKPLNFASLLKKINRLTSDEPVVGPEPDSETETKPYDTFKPAPGTQEETMDEMEEQIRELQQDYAEQLPAKIEEMEELWSTIQNGKNNYKRLARLRKMSHKLIGSGSTFGFDEITQNAQQLELILDMVIMEGEQTLTRRKENIDSLLDNLRLHPVVTTGKQLRRMKL
jgi:DNA-binding response OmpR family regulator